MNTNGLPRRLLKLLEELGPSTAAELAVFEPAQLLETVKQALYRMSKKGELCYVKKWDLIDERWSPVYAAGKGVSKKRPKPMTSTESSRRYYEKYPDKYVQKIVKGTLRRGYKPKARKFSYEVLLGVKE